MKRIILTTLMAIVCTMMALAQSMTDSQVKDYVVREVKAGTSQAQIVTKLMQKGVNIEQMRRVRKQLETAQKNGNLGLVADETTTTAGTRMRKNNGDTKKTTTTSGKVSNGMDQQHTYDMNDDDYMKMRREMTGMLPDSLEQNPEEMEMPLKPKGPKVFGRDIFNKKDLTFEPNMNIATPQNYRLGPGDKVYVDVYGASQKTVEETISPDGTVTIEGFGPVQLSGLTVDQANSRLRSTLGSRYASSKVKLTVGQTRTIMVNVMGEVKLPGTYTLSAFATVFHALYMAGGISDIGTLRNIKVYRQGKLVSQVDVYDYILNGKLTGNVRLTDNDVIVVGPYDCLVNVTGKVKRPMFYEMKKSESMQSLLKYAGGFANDAYTQSVRVVRKTGRQYAVYNVTEFDMSSFKVADGDSVSVDSILQRYENMVEVKGAVFRPGMYQLGGDITTVGALLKSAEGVTEDAFTPHAVMHRMKADRTLEVLSVDIEGILNGTVADIPLRNEDVLFVPTKQSAQNKPTITIHGEVMNPGIYVYADNETLEDFVLQAGGLTERASAMKVDVARRHFDPKAVTSDATIAETFTFQLKDGFVIDGEAGFKLQPFDEVYVRKNPSYEQQRNISVQGEVNFEGNYTLPNRDVRLSDVVKMAGGLTADARPEGARLRRYFTQAEIEQLNTAEKLGSINGVAVDSVSLIKLRTDGFYTVGIELDKALQNPGSNSDVVLQENDVLIVPEYNGTVKINGAVMYPNTISYVKGKSAHWYIKHAGGYANTAKRSRTYIIRQNGMVEKVTADTKVTPGSEIVVPQKEKKASNPQGVALIVSAVSALATVGAVIVSAFK